MIQSAPRPVVGALVWTRIDDDLAVATREGDFAGYVDRRAPGSFFVFDHHSRHVGTFSHAADARSALGVEAPSVRRTTLKAPGARLLRALTSRLTPPTL